MTLRSTTLIVFQAKNETSVQIIQNYFNQMKSTRRLSRTRCLIMASFMSSDDYLYKTLDLFWKREYLDVTILTYDENFQIAPVLSQMNKFKNNYFAQKISSKTDWFPNKLNDFNGTKIYFSIEWSSLSHYDYKKFQERVIQIFTKGMNFEYRDEAYYIFKNTQHLRLYETTCSEGKYNYLQDENILRMHKIDSIKAVIPKNKKYTKRIVFSLEILHMILGTISTILVIRIVAFFMRFTGITWQTLNISKIIMGMAADQEPTNLNERIIFASLLITCIVYTGYFYSVILDISLQMEPEISTLEELANSSLVPLLDTNIEQYLSSSSIPHLKKLSDNSIKMPMIVSLHEEYCLEYLMKHRNVCCIIIDADYYVSKYAAVSEKGLNIKILPEAVGYYKSNWLDDYMTAYSERYSEIILRATEAGLFNEFSKRRIQYHRTQPPEEITKEKLFFIASYVLGVGYIFSIISFVFELFIAMLGKKLNIFT